MNTQDFLITLIESVKARISELEQGYMRLPTTLSDGFEAEFLKAREHNSNLTAKIIELDNWLFDLESELV